MSNIFNKTFEILTSKKLKVVDKDIERPWGGFFVISEDNAQEFSNIYFNGLNTEEIKVSGKLSPKILIIAPNKRLSWQYHHRRKEIWRVFKNKVGVIRSMDDNENEMEIFKEKDIIQFQKEERHRLIGLSDYGIVAEIWIHTESNNPSDEDDIVRLQDDYSRD